MYPNLRAELAKRKMTFTHLAGIMGITVGTMSQKNNGKASFTLDEALAIKNALGTDLTIEELFQREDA